MLNILDVFRNKLLDNPVPSVQYLLYKAFTVINQYLRYFTYSKCVHLVGIFSTNIISRQHFTYVKYKNGSKKVEIEINVKTVFTNE